MSRKDHSGRTTGDGGGSVAWRLRAVAAGFCLLAVAYAARGVHLQVRERDDWRSRAAEQSARTVELPAERGAILDREGRPLATDASSYRAYLAPEELRDQRGAVAAVSRILGLSEGEARRLRQARDGWVAIPRKVSDADKDRLAAAVRQGLHFERLTDRVHPEGDLALNLLGRIGGDGVGRSGLELALDSLLTGEPGAVLSRRDARGQLYPLPNAQVAEPRPGYNIHLTLDGRLQTIAETALERALEETGASGGDLLLMDPRSGEILALASHRSADRTGVPAFTAPYEPGSTAKPFLLAALLAEGVADLDDRVYAEGGRHRTRYGRLITDVHPYDTLSVAEVVRFSSNVGAVKLARGLTPGQQYRYLRDFGFGTPTGIVFPSESGGVLRRPERWSGLSQGSLAMGYEMSVTSLQLAAAYSALANDGVLMRPRLLKEVRDADGRVVWRQRPRELRRVVSTGVSRRVREVLASVVKEGTATRASLATLPVAGKTGTAKMHGTGGYGDSRYAASFVGFAPADEPALVVLTKLEDPQGHYYGGLTAAPISKAVLQAALASRGTLLSRPVRFTGAASVDWGRAERPGDTGPFVFAVGGSPARWAAEGRSDGQGERRVVLPDLHGLSTRAAAKRLHELGLRVELGRVGEVGSQSPRPGTAVERGERVVIK